MKTQKIQIRISQELKRNFENVATKKNMSASEYIRYLMRKEIEKEE